ncbi:MAG: tetratricopeptide repeat protein [Candidatus Krumholzibacteria bacterium]|nr:tetratricopeptide repeat protein [Candidatus Krumholzibacteria bacterium]
MSLFTQPNDFSSNGGQADADSRDRTDTPNGASVWLWVCWLALAGTFAVFAAASYRPDSRLWGVNHLAFFSPRIRLVVLGVTALFFVPPFAAVAWRGLLWLFRPFFRGLESGVNAIALSGVVALVVFAAFRSSTKLLGDGYFIAANFRGAADQGWSIRDYFEQVTLSERVYPVTELINYFASSVGVRFGASPDGGMWILNCALGAAVLVGLLAAIRRTGWPDAVKLLILTLTLISGAIELFFGYIEHYTVAMALGVVYIATALRAVSGEGRVSTPGLVLLAGVLCHVQSLLLLPSYVWLVVWTVGFRRKPGGGIRITLAVGVSAVIGTVAAFLTPALRRLFLPLFGGDKSGVGVISAVHLADVANEVLLLCPAWMLLAVLAVREFWSSGAEETVTYRNTYAFAWCLAIPAALFLLLFRPELGMARDWDLYCFTFFGLAAPGLLALVRHSERRFPPAVAAPAVAVCVALVVSWVGVNANPQRSAARYRAILEYDLTHSGYAYENLARFYEDNHQYTMQADALRSAYETSRNPRYLHNLGRVYYRTGDYETAADMLREYLDAKPQGDEARKLLLSILVKRGATDEMIEVALEGIENSPRIPDYHFYLGNAYLANGRTEEGLKAFESCSRLNPTSTMVQEMKRLTSQVRGTESDSR